MSVVLGILIGVAGTSLVIISGGVLEELFSIPIAKTIRRFYEKQRTKLVDWRVARSDSAARKRLKLLKNRLSRAERFTSDQNALIAMVGVQVVLGIAYFGWVAFMLLALVVLEAEVIEDNNTQIVDTLRMAALVIFLGISLPFFRLVSWGENLFINLVNYDEFSSETLAEIKSLEARLGIDADDEADGDVTG